MSATSRVVALAALAAPATLFVLAALAAGTTTAVHAGETAIADLSQGTNMTVALAPNVATLVVGLVDQLWRVPAAGGGAEALTPADEIARNPRYSPDGGSIVYQRLVDGQWDLWLLDLATRERARAHEHAARRDRARIHGRRPRGRVRVEPHGAFLSLVGRARERRRDATDRGTGRRLVPVRFRARPDRISPAARGAGAAPRAIAVGRDRGARISQRRLGAAELAPRRRRIAVQRTRRHDRQPAPNAGAGRPGGRQADHRRRRRFPVAPRMALGLRVHLRGGRPALATCDRVADPAAGPRVRGPHRRDAAAAGGPAVARRARPADRARHCRGHRVCGRPQDGVHRARRSLVVRTRSAAPAHRRRLGRPRSDVRSGRWIGRLRERAQRPIRALAHGPSRRHAEPNHVRRARATASQRERRRAPSRVHREGRARLRRARAPFGRGARATRARLDRRDRALGSEAELGCRRQDADGARRRGADRDRGRRSFRDRRRASRECGRRRSDAQSPPERPGARRRPVVAAARAGGLRRRGRAAVRRRARGISSARRRARVGRAHRGDRRSRRAADACQGHRCARRDGRAGIHRRPRSSIGARRRAARPHLARLWRHDGARDRARCCRGRRARRSLGKRPTARTAPRRLAGALARRSRRRR